MPRTRLRQRDGRVRNEDLRAARLCGGTYGTIEIHSDGSYIYTLTKSYDTSPPADDGANIEQNRDSFTYQVMDQNGNTATGTIFIDIDDDTPVAVAGTSTGTVDEDGLPGGIDGGHGRR